MLVKFLQWAFWFLGLGLQSVLLVALSRGPGRQFPALYAYVVCLLVTTAADIFAMVVLGRASGTFKTFYWSAELVRQSVLFALVVSLALHALPSGRKNEAYGRMFAIGAVAVWVGSVLIYYHAHLNTWMTAVIRNLSFFTGILNLFVWFTYVRTRSRDIARLMISAGLGLQMTGEAIGQAVRQMNYSKWMNLAGGVFIVLTHLLCLFIWWRAFSGRERRPQSSPQQLPIAEGQPHETIVG